MTGYIVLSLIILVLVGVIIIFNKLYSTTKQKNYELEAKLKKYKDKEIARKEAEESAKKDKEKINTDNPTDNFNHSIEILSDC